MEPFKRKSKVLCIYHKNCVDGFASAWVVASHFGLDHVDFLEANYGDLPPDLDSRRVFIVDFTYRPEELLPLVKKAEVTIIDHHKARLVEWAGVTNLPPNVQLVAHFDNRLSGVGMTWTHFNKLYELPRVLKHIQDWDTQALKLQGTREVIAGLKAKALYKPTNLNFNTFGNLVRSPNGCASLESEGATVLAANREMIKSWIERNSTLVEFEGYLVPLAMIPYEFATEAGTFLCKGYPFSVTYEDNLPRSIRKYSLRSDPDGVEVDAIAQRYGGNGHPHAAGFTLPITERPLGLKWITEEIEDELA